MQKQFLAVAIALAVSGCASIIKGGEQSVTVTSTPSDARVLIVNRAGTEVHNGQTPMTVSLKKGAGYFKKENYTITVSKDGYAPQSVPLAGSASGWYIGGNLVFGGLIGYLIVDPLTGAMWTLSPDAVNAELVAAQSSGADMTLTVVLVADLPVELWAYAMPVR